MLKYNISEEDCKIVYQEIVKRDIKVGTILEGKDRDNYVYLIVIRFARNNIEEYKLCLECIHVITQDKLDKESLRMILLMHINGIKKYDTILLDFKTLKRYRKSDTVELKNNDIKQSYGDIIDYVNIKVNLQVGTILKGIMGNGTPFSLILLGIDKEIGVYYFLKTLVHMDDITEELLPSLIKICPIVTNNDSDLYFYKYVRNLDEKAVTKLSLKMRLLGVF